MLFPKGDAPNYKDTPQCKKKAIMQSSMVNAEWIVQTTTIE